MGVLCAAAFAAGSGALTIEYPIDGSVFPPGFSPPTFIWQDESAATRWTIEIRPAGGARPLTIAAAGEPMRVGDIDPRTINGAPLELTPRQAASHTWKPDEGTWRLIQQRSTAGAVIVSVTGFNGAKAVAKSHVSLRTSRDPLDAPIFYRDVPLMPSETEKGVIKPLAPNALPLVAWRLRDVREPASRLLMDNIHTCANCHSFSAGGKTMGIDVDGPLNDKGLYAVVSLAPETKIRNEDVIAWSSYRGKLGSKLRVGFMSQVSPDGQYVVTTIGEASGEQSDYQRRKNPRDLIDNYYVANFKDHRFLQVFYPTRGILAWYSRETGRLEPLPGADDPRYVHTSAVWSPDGQYLVFGRAEARDPYPQGAKRAELANDQNELQIQYDLYRIPFNEGRGGKAEPIEGASRNGMSNSFPKISPDGKWLVYVQARNGQLMRPDSQLYIVPAGGGKARRMTCNTSLMNSWHSFSPDGRWMVFSSKSRSPYTQMFLTHIDENGNDTPPILVENATAANRAANIPEFVDIPADGLRKIEAPVAEYYRLVNSATELLDQQDYRRAAEEWQRAVSLNPNEPLAHNNLGLALSETGRRDEAVAEFRKALELSPEYPEAHNNLGEALVAREQFDEAIAHFREALRTSPEHASAHNNLGAALAQLGMEAEAIPHLRKAVEYKPDHADAQNNLGIALAVAGHVGEAVPHLEEAVRLSGGRDPMMLDVLGRIYAAAGRLDDAAQAAQRAAQAATARGDLRMADALVQRARMYESGRVR